VFAEYIPTVTLAVAPEGAGVIQDDGSLKLRSSKPERVQNKGTVPKVPQEHTGLSKLRSSKKRDFFIDNLLVHHRND